MENNLSKILRTAAYAAKAHAGVVRKFGGEPYITHPLDVAGIVADAGGSEEMVMAALLHDVVEDTPITIEEIKETFGEKVASLVFDMTKVSKLSDGDRETRKAMDLAHTAKVSAEAATIKLADLISNSRSVVGMSKAFAKMYTLENFKVLAALSHGDVNLHARVGEMLAYNLRSLG